MTETSHRSRPIDSVLARNVVSNWLGYLAQFAVTFFLTPLVVGHLGDARYGVWGLVAGLTGYYGLLDIGLRAGVTQHLTHSLAQRDMARLNRVASSGFAALSTVGLLCVGASLVIGSLASRIFHLPSNLESEAFWCIVIVGSATGFQCAMAPMSAVFAATQRYDLSNAIGVTSRLASALAAVAVLKSGGGLIGLSLATAAGNVADYLARWVIAHRLIPELRVARSLASLAGCREILSFGLWNFLITGSQAMFAYAGTLVIGLTLPIALLAPYVLAASLIRHLGSMIVAMRAVFYPAAARLHAQQQRESLERLYLAGSRFLILVVLLIGVVGWVWCEDFYRLWVGPQYTSAASGASTPLVFRILLATLVASHLAGIGSQVLLGMFHVRALAWIYSAEAAGALVLSYLAALRFGIVGVAAAALICAVCARAVVLPLTVHRLIGLTTAEYVRRACLRPAVAAATFCVPVLLLRAWYQPVSWSGLVLHGVLLLPAAAASVFCFGLSSDERTAIRAAAMLPLRLAGWARATK